MFDSNGNPQGSKEYWEKTPFKTLDEGTSTHVVAAFGNGLESKFSCCSEFPFSQIS